MTPIQPNNVDICIKEGSINKLNPSPIANNQRYIEVQLKKRREYNSLSTDSQYELCCSVTDGLSCFISQDNVSKIKIESSCFCGRDFTEEELKNIIIEMRKDEKTGQTQYVRDKSDTSKYKMGAYVLDKNGNRLKKEVTQYDEIGDGLFALNADDKMSEGEADIAKLTLNINLYFREYNINTCVRKLHFIAQAYVETQRFTKTYETKPSSTVSGGPFYRGRGLLHLTHDYHYNECYTNLYKVEPTNAQLKAFVPKVANSMKIVCQSSCWYWGKTKCNVYAEKDSIANVSAAINRPESINGSTSKINGYSDRVRAYESLKKIMHYEKCDNKK